jgi:hypothetical protein
MSGGENLKLAKYSIGIGDRFGQQGKAQLAAVMKARESKITITPVWNKSFREHELIGTRPVQTRIEADDAVQKMGWTEDYFVDADHVNMKTVDLFIEASDFFTLDVADFIGKSADDHEIENFVRRYQKYAGSLEIPGIDEPLEVSVEKIREIARKYLYGVQEAGRLYRHILERKPGEFIVEVSMDETSEPQTPVELLFILAAISQENIPVQTIAPKFTGRFNKGVDYVGDIARFTREFEQDLAVIRFAVMEFSLPPDLKLSVHSGSDKFAIYGPIRKALKKFDAGLHLKTAGTTWLEELIGLAEAGGDGLALAKEIYKIAFSRMEPLCKPYAPVIDIDPTRLPHPGEVGGWDSKMYTSVLRHDKTNQNYNPHFRQLLHVGYKIAAELGDRYLTALKDHEKSIAKNVFENIYERHIKRLFI